MMMAVVRYVVVLATDLRVSSSTKQLGKQAFICYNTFFSLVPLPFLILSTRASVVPGIYTPVVYVPSLLKIYIYLLQERKVFKKLETMRPDA